MTAILAFLAVWFIVSIPFGIILGRVAAGDLTSRVIVPRDGGDE